MADNPFYRFFRRHDVPMNWRTWRRLPRFPSYKNEYWEGEAHYSPRPDTVDLYLDLSRWAPPTRPADEPTLSARTKVGLRPLSNADWGKVPDAFHGAFADQPPLSGWSDHAASRAAHAIVEWARLGRDGPLVHPACIGAWGSKARDRGPDAQLDWLCGAAIVVTIRAALARGAPPDAGVPHPESPGERMLPHLNWIFVSRWVRREGVATALLGGVVEALRERGHRWLCSTCLVGNSASLLWHWRAGFVVGASGFSFRPAEVVRLE